MSSRFIVSLTVAVEAARSAYATAKVPFLGLIEAQRSRVNLRDRYDESTADYFRRRATLERASGGPLGPTSHLDAPAPHSPSGR
jgi:hypothetical protein